MLSTEDNLRLNVLLAQQLYAVRIDESKMIVYALTEKGEAKVPLNPTGKDEAYIREVKALFSTHVMDSPGGYPVFLKRWTRMGQARDDSLAQMLLLGESEAVVAVVHAPGLTDELAARAWWAMPNAENARCMLQRQAVVEGKTGKQLAAFLMEFLPFEEQQQAMIESVRLVLQPGLISAEEKQSLWNRAQTKRSFYVGFLHGCPDNLPVSVDAHPLYHQVKQVFAGQHNKQYSDNCYVQYLLKVFSPAGQAFLQTAIKALSKPNNQDVVIALLDAIAACFAGVKPDCCIAEDINTISQQAEIRCCSNHQPIQTVLIEMPEMQPYLRAMLVLASLSVKLLNPIFSRSDAIGTVMRKKIKPVTDPVFEQLYLLHYSS